MGTPAYMPPEQARGEVVDERADVYALGAMLYHLLCGEPPYAGPSENVLEKVRDTSPVGIRERVPHAPADLVAIIKRAMERDRASRYAHAGALAEDLVRFQTGQLVGVHDYTFGDLLRRWLVRNRKLAIAVSAFILLAIGGAGWFLSREQHLRRDAEMARDQTMAERDRVQAERLRAESRTLALLEDRGKDELEKGHAFRAAVYLAETLRRVPDSVVYRSLLTEAVRAMDTVQWVSHVHTAAVASISFSHDGRYILSAGDSSVSILDAENGQVRQSWRLGAAVSCAAYSRDSRFVMAGSTDGVVHLWNVAVSTQKWSSPQGAGAIRACSFSPDGQSVAASAADGLVRVLDVATGAERLVLPGDGTQVFSASYSHDGRRIVVVTDALVARVFDANSGKLVARLKGHNGDINAASFSADDHSVLTASSDGTARLWVAVSGASKRIMHNHLETMLAKFSADGHFILTYSDDGAIRVWSVDSENVATISQDEKTVLWSGFVVNDDFVATVTSDGMLRVFAVGGGIVHAVDMPSVATGAAPSAVSSSLDGRQIAVGANDGTVCLVHLPFDVHVWAPLHGESSVLRLSYLASGARLGVSYSSGDISIVELATSRAVSFHVHDQPVWRMLFSPDESRILTVPSYPSTEPRLWNSTGALLATLTGHKAWVYGAAFRPDGRAIATAGRDQTLHLWSAGTGLPLGAPVEGAGQAVAFSPDSKKIAVGASKIRILDAESLRPMLELEGHPNTLIDGLSFDRLGQRLLSAGWEDHAAKIWDVATGRLLVTLSGHTRRLMAAEFSHDGKLVVTAGFDQFARIWDAKTGELLRTIQGPTHGVAFNPDDTKLATGVANSVIIWDVTLDQRSPDELAAYVADKSPWNLVDGRLVLKERPAATVH